MNTEELKVILDKHVLWLKNDPQGVRADLSRANLFGANLSGANLSGANLSGANLSAADGILVFQFEKWFGYYTGTEDITIGCMTKPSKEWGKNYKTIGKEQNFTDFQIEMYDTFIKQCAKWYKHLKGVK